MKSTHRSVFIALSYQERRQKELRFSPGLSDRIKIKSYFIIESNVFAEIELNQMQIESNVFFDFRYDSIRFDLEENVSQKTLNRDGKKKKDHFKRWNVK
jgi:hypothetical protein